VVDVVGVGPGNVIYVVEVKASRTDFARDNHTEADINRLLKSQEALKRRIKLTRAPGYRSWNGDSNRLAQETERFQERLATISTKFHNPSLISIADYHYIMTPPRIARLLQDMQNELIKGGAMPVQPLSGAEIIGNNVRLLGKSRSSGIAVIYVVVNRRPDRRDAPRPPFGAPASAADAGPRLTAGTHDAEVVEELAPRPEGPVVIKHTTSPFNTSDIEV
jgi:hypothetical protein